MYYLLGKPQKVYFPSGRATEGGGCKENDFFSLKKEEKNLIIS